MFSLVAFSESQDPAGAFVNIAAVTDQHVKAVGDKITVPKSLSILIGAAAFVGTVGDKCRQVSPSLRRVNPMQIAPTVELLVPPATHPEWLRPQNAVPLSPDEGLEVEENSNPLAAEQHTVVVALADGPIQPVAGMVYTCHATITLVQLAGAWSLSELTFTDDLPTGIYAIVGARVNAAGAVAFRFVPVGAAHRPGGLVCQDADDLEIWYQRNGSLGEWCEFDTTQPPSVEVIGSAAAGSATYDVFIDVIAK